ncbi:SRPBCC family protein [Silvimonas iriomotensis]|uniref:Activator of HSP90 ATPase n=1 Tax=Silvimonas iriomotensis TaxID=449662 RepID=A0ABQ2PEE3_9NEIS|nr:SRPBCC domain-containing protein [Silvimonas iriomotensis]GGP23777.1 activator of HSP90 ATPase [Silvimonas iriomotensis]
MNMPSTDQALRAVVVERSFAHPQEKVWRALTQGPLLEEWLMSNDFEPVVGHRFTFRMPAMPGWNGITDCEVLTVDAPRQLAYTWCASGEEAATGISTVVTFTLTPTPEGVLLRMEQSGFKPHEDRNLQGANWGWQSFFTRLEGVLAKAA